MTWCQFSFYLLFETRRSCHQLFSWRGLLHTNSGGNLLWIKFIHSIRRQCETALIRGAPMQHFGYKKWKVTERFFFFHNFGMKFLRPFWISSTALFSSCVGKFWFSWQVHVVVDCSQRHSHDKVRIPSRRYNTQSRLINWFHWNL